jgi:hypothetical protein
MFETLQRHPSKGDCGVGCCGTVNLMRPAALVGGRRLRLGHDALGTPSRRRSHLQRRVSERLADAAALGTLVRPAGGERQEHTALGDGAHAEVSGHRVNLRPRAAELAFRLKLASDADAGEETAVEAHALHDIAGRHAMG